MRRGRRGLIGLVLARARDSRLIVTATALVVFAAAVQLAAGPIYADAVAVGVLRQTVRSAPASDATVEITLRSPPGEGFIAADHAVSDVVARLLPSAAVTAVAESPSFQLPIDPTGDRVDLAVFRHREAIEDHATLATGRWPAADRSDVVEVALSEAAASLLDLASSDSMVLTRRRDGAEAAVEITGVYTIDDESDRFWGNSSLELTGRTESESFRTLGPFVVADSENLTPLSPRLDATWLLEIDETRLTVEGVDGLRAAVDSLPAALERSLTGRVGAQGSTYSAFGVRTGLGALLEGTDSALTVTRANVMAVVFQLSLLAGYAMVLVGGLLADNRAADSDLLGARGASRWQLFAMSALEALFVAVPAVLIGPLVAARLVPVAERVGPLGAIGLTLDPMVSVPSIILVVGGAALTVALLAWSSVRIGTRMRILGRLRRSESRSTAQRFGVDTALVAVAAFAFWQLGRLGPDRIASVRGRVTADPLLVVAPALVLLAGAVLALRVVPLLAGLGERLASRRRSVVLALASWQIARRPSRPARTTLLLVMAVGLGFFVASFTATWERSQDDQADFDVGADLRLAPNRRSSRVLDDLHLGGAIRGIDGVADAMGGVRRRVSLPGSERPATLLMLDSGRAGEILTLREDVGVGFVEAIAAQHVLRPEVPGLELPGEPARIEMLVRAMHAELTGPDGPPERQAFEASIRLVIQDGDGLMHRVVVGAIQSDSPDAQRIGVDLLARDQLPSPPLSIVDVEISLVSPPPPPPPPVPPVTFVVDMIDVLDVDGVVSSISGELQDIGWVTDQVTPSGLASRPTITIDPDPERGPLALRIQPGSVFGGTPGPVHFSVSPGSTELLDAIPAVVTRSYLERTRSEIGDVLAVPSLQLRQGRIRIVGSVEAVPTVDPNTADALIVDLATFQMLDHEIAAPIVDLDEYWISVDGDHDAVAATLSRAPFDAVSVRGRLALAEMLRTDAAALGSIGALGIGFVASAVFAIVGFAVSALVTARDRGRETSLLRALGLTRRQLVGWTFVEQLVLLTVGAVLGSALGYISSATLLPLVSVATDGSVVVPSVIVVFPWTTIAVLELALVGAMLAALVFVFAVSRRHAFGESLRAGVD